ncbi:T9SS type A sorting domain-containing protein [Aquimarina sp. SS2-1]|uniref:T9SS type A sorting domain-containing protein n=1 Tax=Aquimarina besae TaxID=3342247 RepID=UPI0036700D07
MKTFLLFLREINSNVSHSNSLTKIFTFIFFVGTFLFASAKETIHDNYYNIDGGEISGGPFTFCVDGEIDNVSGISLSGNLGSNTTWVITDDQGLILGLPPTLDAVEGVDFDGAGAGVCLIWHLSYATIEGLEPGNNALTDLSGAYDLSNSISVIRNAPYGGEIAGGPFEFVVDGEADNVTGISVSGSSGSNATWVITDDQGLILGLPPTIDALEGVDFDGAGVGTCLIWYIRYEEGLEGLEPGNNALTDLSGCFDLSNSIEVVRNEAVDGGEISGGPFAFCVDGEVDNVSGISLAGNFGSNATWVITDDQGLILGLPPTLEAVEGVDFDGAGVGTCLIWHLSYATIEGLQPGNNALTDLSGVYDLSNSIGVVRRDGNSIECQGLGELNVRVFPNPASRFTFVIVTGFTISDLEVKLYDMSGNPVNVDVINKRRFVRIDVSGLRSGVYLVSVVDKNTGNTAIEQLVVR